MGWLFKYNSLLMFPAEDANSIAFDKLMFISVIKRGRGGGEFSEKKE